jgi:hypothetical protein
VEDGSSDKHKNAVVFGDDFLAAVWEMGFQVRDRVCKSLIRRVIRDRKLTLAVDFDLAALHSAPLECRLGHIKGFLVGLVSSTVV